MIKKSEYSYVEILESRIAPAAMVTFTDVDGDTVLVKTSKGTNADLLAALTIHAGQLEKVDFTTNAVFKKTSLDISVKTRDPVTGDGFVNVGLIDSTGMDIGAVTVKGDLGKILAGDTNDRTQGVISLSTLSIGMFGNVTQGGSGDLRSEIVGGTRALKVTTSVKDATLHWSSSNFIANVNHITIGQDLSGSDGVLGEGMIHVEGAVTKLTIGGNIIGGSSDNTGQVYIGSAQKISVGGSLIGGDGANSGLVATISPDASLGDVLIKGDIVGGTGDGSGLIAAGMAKILTIHGSVLGGNGFESGNIVSDTAIKSISILGDLTGGSGVNSGSIFSAIGLTNSFFIGGSIIGGAGISSGTVNIDTVSKVTIGGSVTGGSGLAAGSFLALKVTTMNIHGNVQGGSMGNTGSVDVVGDIRNFHLDGAVIGGAGDGSGSILLSSDKSMMKVSIGGDIMGGDGLTSGTVNTTACGCQGQSMSLTLDGKVQGGSGMGSGGVNIDGPVSLLTIGGNITGGTADSTGYVNITGFSDEVVGKVILGGNLVGGMNVSNSGTFNSGDLMVKSFQLNGNLIGGKNTGSDPISNSGMIEAGGISALSIGGSLISGIKNVAGDINLGAIRVGELGALTVKGSIVGTDTDSFLITAQGNLGAIPRANLAIKSIDVSGNVTHATILAGYDTIGTTINGDGGDNGGSAQIGKVTVTGNWTASSLAAGVSTGASGLWGSNTNTLLDKPVGSTLVASIANIVIGGVAQGGSTQNGFVAERILGLTVGDEKYPITSSTTVFQVGPNPNLVARQIVIV